MTLYEAVSGQKYIISSICVERLIARRLEALGMNDGTTILVLNKKRAGAMIVKVRGSRLGLGKHITSMIEVRKVDA